ncbi:cytokinesis protein bni1 [Moelleriella libera RCEF 2490]|uniref:Cytokinesis protein bni1 n=1 Tax=Moelleriella libera RCEF 2490 TaxID=1081109 RepID=A0A162IPS0_9HYPO|nr:cytokinesis protein bni1 [Moelleriella libera RCEF 2490]
MSSADKSRQSSGGRSLFSRSRTKERRTTDGDYLDPNSTLSFRSSRHKRDSSATSADTPTSPEPGVNMMAGVITSIPYDNIPAGSRSPIPVEYLPNSDQSPARREPLPHHLSKNASDFHQYPSFDPSTARLRESNLTMASTGRQAQYQQWGASRGSVASTANGSYTSRYDSYLGANAGRSSGDNLSLYSGNAGYRDAGGTTRSSQAALPTASSQSSYASHQSSRESNRLTKFPGPGSNHDSFHFPKPDNDYMIEQMFLQLMQKRGWHNLPEQARRQMMAYPPQKKWTLLHQDRLTEWQGEQKRRQTARANQYATPDITTYSDEEGTPEWYVRKVMEDKVDSKGMGSLEVNLRTQQIGWVKRFVECQGQVALVTLLLKINRKTAAGPAVDNNRVERNLDKEYDIIKCLKALMNNKFGADDALMQQKVLVALASCLISARITTRKLVSEILTFLCTWGPNGEGHIKVIQALDEVKSQSGENGRFDAWMRLVEVTVDGRGKMGSLVGASEEVRTGGIGMENLLMEYAVTTLILVNMLLDAPEHDLQLRVHIRAQFTACGIKRILTKMEGFQYDLLDKQIERFRTNEAIDYEDMLERENSSIKDSVEGVVNDLNDPVQIADAIQQRIQGSKAQDYFVSALQHLMLIRAQDGEERLRMFQLVDSMLSYVAMDRRLPNMDLKQSLNFTVSSLLDKLHTDSEARQAQDEALESRQIAEAAMAERDEMRARLELGADGLVKKMQKQLDEQSRFIEAQKRQADGLKAEINSLQTIRAKEAQRNELETRELYLMLRDAQDVAASNAIKAKKPGQDASNKENSVQTQGILDRERLMERLQMQLERQKTQYKLEGRVWGEAGGPSDRLRALREEMDHDDLASPVGAGTPPRDLTNSVLGSTNNRQTRIPRQPFQSQDGVMGEIEEAEGDEGVIFERPRIVEMKRPMIDPQQQAGLVQEIGAKVKKRSARLLLPLLLPPHPPPMPGAMPSGQFLSQKPAFTAAPGIGLPAARPKKKLKALHWEKVDTPETSHWAAHAPSAEEREEKYNELSRKGILEEVEKLFLAKEIKQIGVGGAKKDDKRQIISADLRKAYEIAFAKFSQHSVEKIVQMIIHCDSHVLDNQVVMEFLQKDELCNISDNVSKQMAPYSRDLTGPDSKSQEREQDPAELTRQDQIYLHTAFELHHYWKSRMRALWLVKNLEPDYEELNERINQVVTVSESLRDSVSLMNVLGLILDIGNYMNDANKQARGFKLSSLARLGMVKDDKNESSLADLVERIVRNQYPEWEGFATDISGVLTAQKVNVEALQSDARKYIDTIRNVQMSLDSGNLSDPKKFHPEDRVNQIVQRRMKDARRKAEQMELYLDEMTKTYNDIMVFYGEDPTDDNARRDFFAKLASFLMEWKKSKEKNVQLEEMKKRNEASMKRKRAAQKNAAAAALGEGSASPTSTGAMDSLLEKLRAAAPQARDQRDRRRRARLKDRHQVRVASGQKIPDLDEIPEADMEAGQHNRDDVLEEEGSIVSPSLSSPREGEDDVADRAAALLQGMRGDGGADGERRESLRQARRQTAEEERRLRRRRREKASSTQTVGEGTDEAPAAAAAADGERSPTALPEGDDKGGEQQAQATVKIQTEAVDD